MELGLGIKKGLYLVEDKDGIIKILSKTNGDTNVLKFFANHDINAPIYAPNNLANNLDIPKERCNLVHFNVDDQRQYFELGMIFGCVDEVREEIAKYAISRGVALKFVRSD